MESYGLKVMCLGANLTRGGVVMVSFGCQLDTVWNHVERESQLLRSSCLWACLWWIILIALIEVESPTHYGQLHPLRREIPNYVSELSTSTHVCIHACMHPLLSVLDCGCDVTKSLKFRAL